MSHTEREREIHTQHTQIDTHRDTNQMSNQNFTQELAAETQTEGTTCFSVAPADNEVPDGFGTFP